MNINIIFDQMDYGGSDNIISEAREWIDHHQGKFGPYFMGKWNPDICKDEDDVIDFSNEASVVKLASIRYGADVLETVKKEFSGENADSDQCYSNCLQSFADILAKKINLVAGLEALSTGRSIGRIIKFTMPQAIKWLRHFNSESSDLHKQTKSLGTVVISVSSGTSAAVVLKQVGLALMAGNRIILKISKETSQGARNRINLALLYLADVATEANFPRGSFNVIYSPSPAPNYGQCDSFKMYLDSSQERAIIGPGFKVISIAKFCVVFVVCDSADVNGAVEAVVRAIVDSSHENTQLKVYVQESIFNFFKEVLGASLEKLGRGKCTDVTTDFPSDFSNCELKWEEMGHLRLEAFRTAKEVANLVNGQGHQKVALSLWAELITVALELSDEIKADTVWINCYGEEDPAIECQTSINLKMWWNERESKSVTQRLILNPLEDFKLSEPILKAVDTVVKSQANWQKLNEFERSKKFECALNSKQSWDELKELYGQSEVDSFCNALKTARRLGDYYTGRILSAVTFKGKILSQHQPLGVIVIVPSEKNLLTSLAMTAIPALVAGNGVLLVLHPDQTKAVTGLIKILALPAGVITTVESNDRQNHPQQIVKSLCHTNIRSFLYFGTNDADDVNLPLIPTSATLRHVRIYSASDLTSFQQQQPLLSPADSFVVSEMPVGQRKLIWLPSGVTFAT